MIMQEEIKIDLCKEENIINHYVAFTKIYNEQVKLHGRTREAVLETIHICKSQNVLSEYLSSREKEVVDIMMALFNEEYILKTYLESEKQEAEKRVSEKIKIRTAQKLYKKGSSIEDIADILDSSVKEVEQWLGLVRA